MSGFNFPLISVWSFFKASMASTDLAYNNTRVFSASIFATAVPKLPAPTTPTILLDVFFEVISIHSVMIIIQCIQIFSNYIPFPVFHHRPSYMIHSYVEETVVYHLIYFIKYMRGNFYPVFFLKLYGSVPNPLENGSKFIVLNDLFLFRKS